MLDGRVLYETTRDLARDYLGHDLPSWDELTWPQRDALEAQADELNEAREND